MVISAASQAGIARLPQKQVKFACNQSKNLIYAANKYKIDPYVLASLVFVESRWKKNAVSSANACGLTQVLPKYAPETCKQLKIPKVSLLAGARSLKKWSKNRNIDKALACYNAGYRCLKSKQARRYSNKVLKIEAWLKKQAKTIEP